jgi:hypothetical protein
MSVNQQNRIRIWVLRSGNLSRSEGSGRGRWEVRRNGFSLISECLDFGAITSTGTCKNLKEKDTDCNVQRLMAVEGKNEKRTMISVVFGS